MLILSHRGWISRATDENTLPAFEQGLALGADGIECDVRLSKDGELALVHDASLNRVAGDARRVRDILFSELAQIPLRHGGRIPSLNELTSTIHAPAILDLEVKDRKATQELIKKLNTSSALRERVIVSSFYAPVLAEVKRACPDVRTLYLVARWPISLRGERLRERLTRFGPWGIAFPVATLNPSRVELLKSMGVKVGAWDRRRSPREAARMSRLDLDLVIVHRVDVLKTLVPRYSPPPPSS